MHKSKQVGWESALQISIFDYLEFFLLDVGYRRAASVPRSRATPTLKADAWNSQIFVNRYAKEDDRQRTLGSSGSPEAATGVAQTSRNEPVVFDFGGYETGKHNN